MNLKQYYLTKNECFKRNVQIKLKGLMLHSTGANNPNLKRYVPDFDGTIGKNTAGNHWDQYRPDGRQVCVHGFIGKLADGSIATVQTLPWHMRGWHAGKAEGNNSYIGVEICEDDLNDSNYFNKVYQEAVELFAYLCKQYNLNPMTDILCHSEGFKKGIASNHSDVMHWFPKHGKSMDTFRADVQKILNGATPAPTPTTSSIVTHVAVTANVLNIRAGAGTNYKVVAQAYKGGEYDVYEIKGDWGRINGGWFNLDYTTYNPSPKNEAVKYLVRINTYSLNVRDGAGTTYKINTTVKQGEIYTIVEEKNGWGKLKSGAGWIKLSYTVRV